MYAEQLEGCYELSVGNADKGLMPIEEIQRRVQPFIDQNLPLVLTQASGLLIILTSASCTWLILCKVVTLDHFWSD